jgi:hypothetical protein
MFKKFKEKMFLSGFAVLIVGVALLVFTFISAYLFLTQSLSITASEDLVRTFGEALAPLILTCIRIMYLGVMGWVGSLLTIRGITIIVHTPRPALVQGLQPQPQIQKSKKEQVKEEVKPSEPEMAVIPPEQVLQPPSEKKKSAQSSE